MTRGAGGVEPAPHQTGTEAAEGVSVVVPVHDGARYLGEALHSVISQQPPPLEVIVVDDCSSDDSAAIAMAFGPPVRVMAAVGQGAAAARNTGVKAAKAPLIAFLDADDRWAEGALAHLGNALMAEPQAGIAHGRVGEFVSPDLSPEIGARLAARPGAPLGLIPGSLLVRAELFQTLGFLDTGLRAGEVVDWIARLRHAGVGEAWTEAVVLERRVHGGHLSAAKKESRADLLEVVRRSLARQRGQEGAKYQEVAI